MAATPPTPAATLTLPSGRVLAWNVYGSRHAATPSSAPPASVFYFHGFPGSRLEAGILPSSLLEQHAVQCVALDRPGMGASTYDASRTLLDWPVDVLAVADHLGIRQFYVWGLSGGAPYVLACARAIPRAASAGGEGRLLGATITSGLFPPSLGTQGMLPGLRALLLAGAWLPRAATGLMLDMQFGKAARNEDPRALEDLFDRELAGRQEVEALCYKDERVRRGLVDGMREALRPGSEGVAHELMLYTADWGFRLDEVDAAALSIWHGQQDKNVPVHMAKKAAQSLRGAKLHILDREAHISTPVRHVESILREMLSSAGQAEKPGRVGSAT